MRNPKPQGITTGFEVRPQTSYPFTPDQVGPHYEQPIPSQFVWYLVTDTPAILPWGKTYADVEAGNVPGFNPAFYGPPPPYLSYTVSTGGEIVWSTDPHDAPPAWNTVPMGNPGNPFPGGGLYESYRGKVAANYYVSDSGPFPSTNAADAVANLQRFAPGSSWADAFDPVSGQALSPSPAYPIGPPASTMTPGTSGGVPVSLPGAGAGAVPGVAAGPAAVATTTLPPFVLVLGLILLFVLLDGGGR